MMKQRGYDETNGVQRSKWDTLEQGIDGTKLASPQPQPVDLLPHRKILHLVFQGIKLRMTD